MTTCFHSENNPLSDQYSTTELSVTFTGGMFRNYLFSFLQCKYWRVSNHSVSHVVY